MGQRDLQASMTLYQDFPGKVTHCNHVTFISIAQWSVEEDNTKMGKKPKAKKDTAAKMKKPENVLRGKTTNPQTAFKLTIPGDCSCFCIMADTCTNKRKRRFQLNVWLISIWRRCLCLKSERQRGARFHRVVLFLSLFSTDFLLLFIFPWAKIFPEAKSFHAWILSSAQCKQNL